MSTPAASLPDVVVLLAQLVADKFGVTPLRVMVPVKEDPEHPICLPLVGITGNGRTPPPPTRRMVPADDPEEMTEGCTPALHPCVVAILTTLREHGKPLTKTRLFEEMARRQHHWSETTTMKYMKNLIDDGTVENPEAARPRGYRLPEWETTCDES